MDGVFGQLKSSGARFQNGSEMFIQLLFVYLVYSTTGIYQLVVHIPLNCLPIKIANPDEINLHIR